jgi:AraC family transcriptional regulator, transcriptional activator FtrA
MHEVVAVVADGANPFELAVACEVFGIDRSDLGVSWYRFQLCGPQERVRLHGGWSLSVDASLDAVASADTVVVPQGNPNGPADRRVVEAVRAAHDNGARLVSFCTGAFTVAATGRLDGRRATTHWMYACAFRRRFPRVHLDPNVLFLDEGDVLTSAGTAAGIDLSLHIVRRDYGAGIARAVARRMVVPPHPDGGQAQFIDPPRPPRVEGDALAPLFDWLQEHLHEDIPVSAMARRAAMSERTFVRRFKESTGTTPFRWLLTQRLARAQELLEGTDLDVDAIARRAGFGTATNLRTHFRRELATTPSIYRRSFLGRAPESAA